MDRPIASREDIDKYRSVSNDSDRNEHLQQTRHEDGEQRVRKFRPGIAEQRAEHAPSTSELRSSSPPRPSTSEPSISSPPSALPPRTPIPPSQLPMPPSESVFATPGPPLYHRYKAMEDFGGKTEQGELPVKKGEIVLVLQKGTPCKTCPTTTTTTTPESES